MLTLNPRPAGGGGALEPPPRFIEDSENTAALRAAGFSPTWPPCFPQLLWKFRRKVMQGQVKWPNFKISFQPRHGYNILGKVMKLSEYDKVISAYKIYISDFWYRWPQVRSFLRPPHYKSMGKKSTPFLAQAYLSGITSYRIVIDISRKTLHCLPLERSFEVTRGHQQLFANNFWSKRVRDVRLVSVPLSRPGESSGMQYDPFWSPRDLGSFDLIWPELKLWTWSFKVILYGSTRLNETNTMI